MKNMTRANLHSLPSVSTINHELEGNKIDTKQAGYILVSCQLFTDQKLAILQTTKQYSHGLDILNRSVSPMSIINDAKLLTPLYQLRKCSEEDLSITNLVITKIEAGSKYVECILHWKPKHNLINISL